MPSDPRDASYEKKDANVRGILIFMALVAGSCVLAYGAVRLLYARFESRARQADETAAQADVLPSVARPSVYFPLPREQPAPAEDLAAYRARESAKLDRL